MNEGMKKRIYLDPNLNRLSEYYDRDIVKVLSKNLKEAYLFWGISTKSFENILNTFECSKEEIFFKLLVNYRQEDKIQRHKEIFVPPFTNNWFLQFEQTIKSLKVEVIAYSHGGHNYSLLHSAEISVPSHKPSKILHKDWIKPGWVLNIYVVEFNGVIHLQDGPKTDQNNFLNSEDSNFNNLTSDELPEWHEGFFVWPDGSSGFMGSSGIFASSSNHMRKSNEQ